MQFFPTISQTLVLPFPKEDVFRRLRNVTLEPGYVDDEGECQFNGKVSENSFSLSRKVDYGNNSLPLVKGKIESTKSGSLVLVEYHLFPAAKTMVKFTTLITLFAAGFFLSVLNIRLYGFLVIGFQTLHLMVIWLGFRKEVRKCKDVLADSFKIS